MCEHAPNREAAMVTVAENVWCDPCLAPIVKALNEGGLPTVASCCGHGTHYGSVALADGRWLLIVPDNESWTALDNRITPAAQRVSTCAPSEFMDALADKYGYTGGLGDAEVRWIPTGSRFVVNEYDGSESLEMLNPDYGYVA